jgi:hypothetical protein
VRQCLCDMTARVWGRKAQSTERDSGTARWVGGDTRLDCEACANMDVDNRQRLDFLICGTAGMIVIARLMPYMKYDTSYMSSQVG